MYKDGTKTDVRLVGVSTLRRLLTGAYCTQTRAKIIARVQESQLGVMKESYEIGVHSRRELARILGRREKRGHIAP